MGRGDGHGRRRVGTGETFWQYRRYEIGDSATMIDWRQSGKTQPVFVRENEWEAAQSQSLPELLTLQDIRGDLHSHSTWSDGQNSLDELAETLGSLHYSAGVTGSEVMSASGYTLKWLKL